jgi:hypothetical protein
LKNIQKLLGQADKKNAETYTNVPNTMSGLEKISPPGEFYDTIQNLEVKMHCKDATKRIITQIEDNDPQDIASTIVKEVVDSSLRNIELRVKKLINPKKTSASGKRLVVFHNSTKTWKERAVVMFFFQHLESLGKEALYNAHALVQAQTAAQLE